jgi:hypothetical protein
LVVSSIKKFLWVIIYNSYVYDFGVKSLKPFH